MFHLHHSDVRAHLLEGTFGLERESLRITADGIPAHTPDPFAGHANIVRDFSENQVEINTGVWATPREALDELAKLDAEVQETLAALNPPELLWPFSNPPYLRGNEDIPLAQYAGSDAYKTQYRAYLAKRYGRYKMTFSGVHFNFSFSDELLRADFAASEQRDFASYRNKVYLQLAERCVAYGWMMSALTAASPLMDSSFVEQGNTGGDLYFGLGSVRCSELGYWNDFSPVLDYADVHAYTRSIERYLERGLLAYPSELYFPVRVKSSGAYTLANMREQGLNHIELRMFDLNPNAPLGIAETDMLFAQLFLVWLACLPPFSLSEHDQIRSIQNFKNAAHYDLRTVNVSLRSGESCTMQQAALQVMDAMDTFYRSIEAPQHVFECLEFQRNKLVDQANYRYAHLVRRAYSGGFVKKGLELAHTRQAEALARGGHTAQCATCNKTPDAADIEEDWLSRTRLLLGAGGVHALENARVAVFGVGGVGGYVVEALARSGVGALDLIDADVVCASNINRQVIATWDNIGRSKVQVAAERVARINPSCRVTTHECFFLPDSCGNFDFTRYDYVVDAVDTIAAKVLIAQMAQAAGVPAISSMGAGNKLDASAFRVADIFDTRVDKLAKTMRRELRKRGISHLKVVYSEEEPAVLSRESVAEQSAQPGTRSSAQPSSQQTAQPAAQGVACSAAQAVPQPAPKRAPIGSVAFVPSVAGLIIAGEVIKDLARSNA